MLIPEWMQCLGDFKQCGELLAALPGDRLPALCVVDYSRIDSGLSDGPLYPLTVAGVDKASNWEGLSHDDYRAKKGVWLDAVVAGLNREWPGLAAAIVQKEMATARTMHEYLGTPDGAIYGFAPNVPQRMLAGPPRTPKTSIPGLLLASAYAGAGGFTGAMSAGGAAAKAALRGTDR